MCIASIVVTVPANYQALTVNKQVAAHAAAMLLQFITGELRYYALYFDQASGTARSRYITPENVKNPG